MFLLRLLFYAIGFLLMPIFFVSGLGNLILVFGLRDTWSSCGIVWRSRGVNRRGREFAIEDKEGKFIELFQHITKIIWELERIL